MFGEKLKTIRKARGLSQEETAARLNVVRQTVSKWEKGLSVPDAEMLVKISDLFEVSVSELLGAKFTGNAETDGVAEQLSRINEQLVIKNRRSRLIWKVILWILIGLTAFTLLAVLFNIAALNSYKNGTQVITHHETVVSEE